MLTIFTVPKPFRDHIGVIQKNAIRSWLALSPDIEVILFGNDEGIAEVARELGTRHVANIEKNDYGTPLLDTIFRTAQDLASHRLMCFVNSDIIFMSDLIPAIQRIEMQSFLLVGRRWDLDITDLLDFSSQKWKEQLRTRLLESGKLHGMSGLDYFIFPNGILMDMPPFAIGRTSWDNWIPYWARKLKLPLIDASDVVQVIHQNHDYSHIPKMDTSLQKGIESIRNQKLLGNRDHAFTLEYATMVIGPKGLKTAMSPRHLYFRLRAIPILYSPLQFILVFFKIFEKLVRVLRTFKNG